MNVSLTPELVRWVSQKVSGGRYRSASEVVRDGLRLLQEKDEEHVARLDALQRDIRAGLDELERGESVDGEDAFDRVTTRIARHEEAAR